MPNIIDYLKSEQQIYLSIMQKFIDEQKSLYSKLDSSFSEMLGFIEEYLLRGGKWHRAALGVLSYQLAGGDPNLPIRNAVIASDVMHRFLLVHDDIIDRDLFRHGGPTIENRFKELFKIEYPQAVDDMYSKGMAMIAGDLIHSFVGELISQTPFDLTVKETAKRAFHELSMETVAGWRIQTEQNFMNIEEVTEDAFFKGMQLVSAQYSVVWPLRMGQIFAGRLSKESWDKNIEKCGWHTGAAFQITDDIIGMFGDEKETGKPVGHDYREGKKTLLIIYAYARGSAADKEFLTQTLGTDITPTELERARNIITSTGSLEYSKQLAKDHTAKAKAALKNIKTSSPQSLELLYDLAEFLANRNH